jgi:hypothetical protein
MGDVPFTTILLAALFPVIARADVNTGLLEREIGFVGDEIGARVTDIDRSVDGLTILDLTLPSLVEKVDSVEVLDNEDRAVEQVRRAEIDNNGTQSRVGVRLYLERAPKMDYRLRLYDDKEE